MSKAAHHVDLSRLAWRIMKERGLEPDYSPQAMHQVDALHGPADEEDPAIRDLRHLHWCSIDNDDSRDLDQLTVAEPLGGGRDRVYVAIADVDALVKKATPVDDHARHNTTSVYTAPRIFPMLPERLSTDLTSLNPDQTRLAIVMAYVVEPDGSCTDGEVFRAKVHNHAKLAYNSVAAWIDGKGEMPEPLKHAHEVAKQVRLQITISERLREVRFERGALDLQTLEPKAQMVEGEVLDIYVEERNCAKELIEDFMISANGITTQFLLERGFPTFRRVVRSPERWDRIERLALEEYNHILPADPDSKALAQFLVERRRADPLRFPDLSLQIVKMLGAGEYVVQMPGEETIGHFGLAVKNYSHSTAPNRRFPDLITQRLLKAALAGQKPPYSHRELGDLAQHCTEQEDAANRVERHLRKSAAASLLRKRVGESFDALVTGSGPKGTWVRTLQPPVEGKLVGGGGGLDVGDRVTVKLVEVNIEQGFIDFVRR